MDDTECCLEREREGGRDDALDEGLESSIEASEGVLERLRLCAGREGSDARYARFLMLWSSLYRDDLSLVLEDGGAGYRGGCGRRPVTAERC